MAGGHAEQHNPFGDDPIADLLNLPTASEKAALTGTSGVAGAANRYVTNSDTRMSDARTPTGAASGQLGGNYPSPDVRGLRESGGPTLLTLGAVADGQYLKRSGATVVGDAPTASVDVRQVEADLGATPRRSGKFNIADGAIQAGTQIVVSQAAGPYTGKGTLADEAEMDAIECAARVTGAGAAEVFWRSRTFVKSNVKFNWMAG